MPQTDPIILSEQRPVAQGMRPIGRVYGDGQHIYVETPFRFKDTCKRIPGSRWGNPKAGVWNYPFTAAAAQSIVEAFQRIAIDFDQSIWTLLENHEKATAFKTSDDLPEIPCTKTTSWQHQRQCFWWIAQMWGGLPE